MDEPSVTRYITETFANVEVVVANGGTFFFLGSERHFPFATLVNTDEHDAFSDLNRPGVFRLNIGVTKDTFLSLFGSLKDENGEPERDFTVLDRILPHPVYGKLYWLCILSPGDETFRAEVQPLLAEAYEMNFKKVAKRTSKETAA